MGSLMSKISDDIETYEWLCERYDEKPELVRCLYGMDTNPYGEHCKKLKERYMREREALKLNG